LGSTDEPSEGGSWLGTEAEKVAEEVVVGWTGGIVGPAVKELLEVMLAVIVLLPPRKLSDAVYAEVEMVVVDVLTEVESDRQSVMAVAQLATTVSGVVEGVGVVDEVDMGVIGSEETHDRMEVAGRVSLAPVEV
jgi:hypothetical protein